MSGEATRIAAFVAPLALDTLALAIGLGLRGISPLRPAIVCAVFEGTMPAVGALIAIFVSVRYSHFAVFAGAAILVGLGIHALREAAEGNEETAGVGFGSLRSMMLAGFAISADELAVGFPLGVAGLPIGTVLAAISAQAFAVAYLGVMFGRRLGRRVARQAGVGAGVAFIALGAWLVVEHFRT